MEPRHGQQVITYYIHISLTLERKDTKKTLFEGSLANKMLANHFLKHKSLQCCSQTGQQYGSFQELYITLKYWPELYFMVAHFTSFRNTWF